VAARDAQPGAQRQPDDPETAPEPAPGREPAAEPPAAADARDEVRPVAKRRPGASVGQTIGGILVGFDEQVWSRRPPAQERVQQIDRLGTVVTPTGLTIRLPDETAAAGEATATDSPDGGGASPGGPEAEAST
jgi:hypothetical protein